MKNKILITVARILVPLLFWVCVWDISSLLINNAYFLPSVSKTFSALLVIIRSKYFFKVVMFTLLRVIIGLFLGCVLGIILAFLSNAFSSVKSLVSPLMSVIKSTPVATFIIILWVIMSGDSLAVFIAILMVMPIIWQNTLDGFDSIDRDLMEVCHVYEFSFVKKMKLLILPTLKKFLIPAIITSTGLAWKSEIAAEIIAYTKNSIGQYINDAKYNFDTSSVFAWTIIIIVMSISLEKITKHFLGRCKI